MAENKEVHVVMLPWLAFGHMIPFLDLSIALAKSGIHVSYLSTPRNIQRLPKIPQNLSKFITYVPIPLPKLDCNPLPENAESSIDIADSQMDDLKIACDLLQEPIKNFIAEKSPDWIMVDFFQHWAISISQDLSIPIISYLLTSASTDVFFWSPEFIGLKSQNHARKSPHDFTVPPPWVDFPSQVACKNHEAVNMQNLLYGGNKTGIPDGARVTRLVHNSRAVVIRTSMEFEGDYLKLYSKITGKAVFPIGFLPPEKPEAESIMKEEPWSKIFDWLEKQKQESVVFVGFGSEYKLSKVEIHEIAFGLELSGVPFFWALRKPEWAGDDDDINRVLPSGFSARVVEQGVVHLGWIPQREILGHPSIGGSLFHSGWGSIIECMVYGHRLVLLPSIIDQPLEARLMVEKGLGIEVERGDDGSFTGNEIANALRKAMFSEEGEMLKAHAKEAACRIFANQKLNDEYNQNFVEYLKSRYKGKGFTCTSPEGV